MNKHLITETNDGLTLEEKIDFNAETITDLTPEQLEKLYNNRRAEQLLTEQEHRLNLQSKYTSRPLPGNTNDDRWICLKAHFPDDKADKLNWLIGSTSGIHGSSTTLDNLEDLNFLEENEMDQFDIEAFTILIIQSRVVRITHGTIGIRSEDDIN